MKTKFRLVLDSGAFSLYLYHLNKAGAKIGDASYTIKYVDTKEFCDYIERYAAYLQKNKDIFEWYVNLDVIFNPELSWKSQEFLESKGLKPIPVFHFNTDFKHLDRMIDNYEYIGIGGISQLVHKSQYFSWLSKVIKKITDDKGNLIRKIHGFACTSVDIMRAVPWTSVDSSSWVNYGHFGRCVMPDPVQGYAVRPVEVFVSTRSSKKHWPSGALVYQNMPEESKRIFDAYAARLGFSIGVSVDKLVPVSHELRQYEKKIDSPLTERKLSKKGLLKRSSECPEGHKFVEKRLVRGLCNHHELRDQLNFLFFCELQKSLGGTIIYLSGNFDLLVYRHKEERMKDLAEHHGHDYNRLISFYFDEYKRNNNLVAMKKEELGIKPEKKIIKRKRKCKNRS